MRISDSSFLAPLIVAALLVVIASPSLAYDGVYEEDAFLFHNEPLPFNSWSNIVVPRNECAVYVIPFNATAENRLVVQFEHIRGSFAYAGLTKSIESAEACSFADDNYAHADFAPGNISVDPSHGFNNGKCVPEATSGLYFLFLFQGVADDDDDDDDEVDDGTSPSSVDGGGDEDAYLGKVMPLSLSRNIVKPGASCAHSSVTAGKVFMGIGIALASAFVSGCAIVLATSIVVRMLKKLQKASTTHNNNNNSFGDDDDDEDYNDHHHYYQDITKF